MRPYLYRVTVEILSCHGKPRKVYTAKLVKRILASGAEAQGINIDMLFRPTPTPKLFHITPLYRREQGKVRTVYYLGDVTPGAYEFYVGSMELGHNKPNCINSNTLIDMLLSTPPIIDISDQRFEAYIKNINEIEISAVAKEAVKQLEQKGKLRITFASPTLLRDPFVKAKHKSLIPTPLNIFSTPVYLHLYITGRLTRKNYYKQLLSLHRAFGVPHTYLETVKIKRVTYEPGKTIPALIGYLNLHLNTLSPPPQTKEILEIILTLGTGTSRATGFGHITTNTENP